MYKSGSAALFLAFFVFGTVHGQQTVLRGKVVDAKTMEALPFASVFINFTTVGTNADENGEFVLTNIPEGDQELICSYVGHENYQVRLSKLGTKDFLEIKLKPLELKEVEVVSKKDEEWNRQLQKFQTLFLGSSKASRARIVNPWVLDFTESPQGIFTAKAMAPLEIENSSLGYQVTYVLRIFTHSPDGYNILGDIRFREIPTEDPKLKARWNENRLKAYRGSSRHLFRSIIDKTFESEGFNVYVDQTGPGPLVRSPFFKNDLNTKLLPFESENKVLKDKAAPVYRIIVPARLEVHYRKRMATESVYRDITHAVSWIEVWGGIVEVNAKGVILNPSRMVVSGALGTARIADMLPYDYDPELKVAEPADVAERKPVISELIEKPYIQTDKPYYYPGEIIWYKGYLNYADHQKIDSLSKVLYVDLISDNKIISQQILPIDNAMVTGQARIPSRAKAGDYYLRAYTTWMRNFRSEFIFVKPLKVLNLSESVAAASMEPASATSGVAISPNKDKYETNERIQLKLAVTDSAGNPMMANLSVSVTDVLQVSPVPAEKTIIHSFPIREAANKSFTPKFKVEYGLCFEGEFINNKGNPAPGAITIVEGNFENVLSVAAKDDGKFSVDHIHFNDSVKIAAQGKGLNKKTGNVKFYRIPPPELPALEPLKVNVIQGGQRYRVTNVEDTASSLLLPEITVKYNRDKDNQNVTKFKEKRYTGKHGTPDVTIDGEWLRKMNSTNLLNALQSRVAGLRVTAYMVDGVIHYGIRIGAPSTFAGGSNSTPLIVVNDVPLALDPDAATQYLMSLNSNEIQRIEILKYGKGAAYGTRGGAGVIAIYLRTSLDGSDEGPVSRAFDTREFQTFTLAGYSTVSEFRSPEYSVSADSDPDYRSTVLWNPAVPTDNGGIGFVSFYAADLPTSYRVVVEGVTLTGQPVRGETILTIEDKK
jgi:hypothetical protein